MTIHRQTENPLEFSRIFFTKNSETGVTFFISPPCYSWSRLWCMKVRKISLLTDFQFEKRDRLFGVVKYTQLTPF